MSYDSPAPQAEEPTEADPSTDASSPADPDQVDPASGTDGTGAPVDNPTG